MALSRPGGKTQGLERSPIRPFQPADSGPPAVTISMTAPREGGRITS
jgi:hypothetical protein